MTRGEIDPGVLATYEAWEQAWRDVDVEAIKSLWDQEFDGLVYQSEENPKPLLSWQAISDYWDAAPTILESIPEWRSLTLDSTMVNGLALVFTNLMTSLRLKGIPRSFDGELRCSLVMHETEAGWRLIHYHESRVIDLPAIVAELSA
jgi:hypothetical protein